MKESEPPPQQTKLTIITRMDTDSMVMPQPGPESINTDKTALNFSTLERDLNISAIQTDPDLDTSLQISRSSSELAELKYESNHSHCSSESWTTPTMQRPQRVNILYGTKEVSSNIQPLKFHVPSNYSIHRAFSPAVRHNRSFEFNSVSVEIFEIFGNIYTFFAMELSIQQQEQLGRTILYPLESITESTEKSRAQTIISSLKFGRIRSYLKKFGHQFQRAKYYLILLGFLVAIICSVIQIVVQPATNQRILLNICCILWFLRYALTLFQQRQCILSSYTNYIKHNDKPSARFNWLEIHLKQISSKSDRSRIFNEKWMFYSLIICSIFVSLSCSTLGYLLIHNAISPQTLEMPIVSDVFLFSAQFDRSTSTVSSRIIFALWIWFELSLTICFMVFLLPSFIVSCLTVTKRFNGWKEVLDQSDELQFSQIRSYLFQGRHLLRIMNEQWSFYLTISIFTTLPHILLQLYTLVMTERQTSAMNQLFGWSWFLVIFTECSITCYYGANIHKSFEALSKSVVDLGSRTMIQGDEQYVSSASGSKSEAQIVMPPAPKSSPNEQNPVMMQPVLHRFGDAMRMNFGDEEKTNEDDETESTLNVNTKLNAMEDVDAVYSTSNVPVLGKEKGRFKAMNTSKVVNSANDSSQISINLLLLIVSSRDSIDGISIGGIFTLDFSVIAKFLSALFTFGILFIELTRAESPH